MLNEYYSRKYRTEGKPSVEANLIRDKTAIVGIGQTAYTKVSDRDEVDMACEAIKAAVDDAGLRMQDIDGLESWALDRTSMPLLISSLGIPNLTYYGDADYGGGACCSVVLHASAAVAMGLAKYVVCYRSVNDASGPRYGRPATGYMEKPMVNGIHFSYQLPFGVGAAPPMVAMYARRYMHEYGITSRQIGWVSVVFRENAQKNPKAMFYGKPITIEDHQQSDIIVEPLHRLDCCLDTDGAAALIVTTAERAKDLKQRPAYVLGVSQGLSNEGEIQTSFSRPDITGNAETWYAAQEAYRVAGVGPKDIDVAQLYDPYTVNIPMQLEDLGFCGRGEGGAFVDGGDRIRVGGEIPLNTAGGLLSEAYMHGMNHMIEGVRQMRGTSTNQVKDAELCLVTGGPGVPTGVMILRR